MQKNKSHSIPTLKKSSPVGLREILFSFVFAAILVVGHILFTNIDIDVQIIGAKKGLGYAVSFLITWGIALFFLVLLKRLALRQAKVSDGVVLERFSDKKLWLITSLVIFTCYLPVILLTVSVLSPDSWSSLGQVTGAIPLSNANPVIFTGFVGLFISIGLLFNSFVLGTLLFSLAQSAILAMIFALVIVWMRKEKIGKYGIVAALIFYAILPVNAVAGTIMWKDMLFSGFALLFLIVLRKLYLEKDAFFTRKNITYFVVLAFLFCTFRTNGLYAYVLFFVLAIILAVILKYKVLLKPKFFALLLSPLLLAFVYLSLVVPLFAKPATTSYGMLCVPVQQIARTVKYHINDLSAEEKATINEIFPVDQLGELYNPNLSDPAMGSLKTKAYDENKPKYLGLWFQLLAKYPQTFIAATLYNTYGYTYPYSVSPTPTDTIMDNSIHVNAFKDYSDPAFVDGNKQAVVAYGATISNIAPVVHNIGFYTCVLLLAAYVAMVRKKRELLGVFLILLCLFLSTVAGPVNGEFRYLYLFVIALPFILGSVYVGDGVKGLRLKKK